MSNYKRELKVEIEKIQKSLNLKDTEQSKFKRYVKVLIEKDMYIEKSKSKKRCSKV